MKKISKMLKWKVYTERLMKRNKFFGALIIIIISLYGPLKVKKQQTAYIYKYLSATQIILKVKFVKRI